MKRITFLFFIFNSLYCVSQVNPEWVVYYQTAPDDMTQVNSVEADQAGNVYLFGYSQDTLDVNARLFKYNSSGTVIWMRLIADIGPYAKMKLDKKSGVYISSRVYGLSFTSDYLTLKFDTAGNLKWWSVFNGTGNNIDQPYDFVFDDSLNVIVTGEGSPYPIFHTAFTTVKLDSSGNEQWSTYSYNPTYQSRAFSVDVDHQNNIYVSGSSPDSTGGMLTVKYDGNGTNLWERRDGTAGLQMKVSRDFIYSLGFIYQSALCIKYDSAGNIIFRSVFNQTDTVIANGNYAPQLLLIDSLENIYIAGVQYHSTGQDAMMLVRLDSSGNVLWRRVYDTYGWDHPKGMMFDRAGNICLALESFDTTTSGAAIAALKYDPSGNLLWSTMFSGPLLYSSVRCTGLSLDSLNNMYVAGTLRVQSVSSFVLLKYSALVGVDDIEVKKPTVILFPNPFRTTATFNLQCTPDCYREHHARLRIYNSLGGFVREEKIIDIDSYVLSRGSLPDGFYFYELRTLNNEHLSSGKFIVE